MRCEKCSIEITTKYGSGRFCSAKCARGYSTLNKRGAINEKIAKAMLGNSNGGFNVGFNPNRKVFTNEERAKGLAKLLEATEARYKIMSFEDMSKRHKKRFILEEQEYKCLWCGLTAWRDLPISFEFDHIDGNNKNNSRDNLRCLCPNCHSQTDTWRKKKSAPVM